VARPELDFEADEQVIAGVRFFPAGRDGIRLEQPVEPMTSDDLDAHPVFAELFTGFGRRLAEIRPLDEGERQLLNLLRNQWRAWTARDAEVHVSDSRLAYWFKYLDPESGGWRALWCWGYVADPLTPGLPALLCDNPSCASLFLHRGVAEKERPRCPHCSRGRARVAAPSPADPRPVTRSKGSWRKPAPWIAAAALLALVGVAWYLTSGREKPAPEIPNPPPSAKTPRPGGGPPAGGSPVAANPSNPTQGATQGDNSSQGDLARADVGRRGGPANAYRDYPKDGTTPPPNTVGAGATADTATGSAAQDATNRVDGESATGKTAEDTRSTRASETRNTRHANEDASEGHRESQAANESRSGSTTEGERQGATGKKAETRRDGEEQAADQTRVTKHDASQQGSDTDSASTKESRHDDSQAQSSQNEKRRRESSDENAQGQSSQNEKQRRGSSEEDGRGQSSQNEEQRRGSSGENGRGQSSQNEKRRRGSSGDNGRDRSSRNEEGKAQKDRRIGVAIIPSPLSDLEIIGSPAKPQEGGDYIIPIRVRGRGPAGSQYRLMDANRPNQDVPWTKPRTGPDGAMTLDLESPPLPGSDSDRRYSLVLQARLPDGTVLPRSFDVQLHDEARVKVTEPKTSKER
jgi:hypothetical protein